MIPYHTLPREHDAIYKLYPTAAAVGNTINVRSQMIRQQTVESTTLQPCCTAAAVGDTIYVRLACPCYAEASCLCRSLSQFVTPPYRTFLLCCRSGCACPSMRKHRDLCNSNNLDTNPSLYIHVHRGSSLTSIVSVFLRKSQMADSRQRAESKTLQVGPCACACCILSLRRRVAFFCHSICHVLLSSCSLVLNTCRISRHTCPFSLSGGP